MMRKAALLFMLALLPLTARAQTQSGALTIPGLPTAFHWQNHPADWYFKDGSLTIKSEKLTDWYIAPTGDESVASSPLLLLPAAKDFWFSSKVTVDFKSPWDAGSLVLYADQKNWIKFAFESPNGRTGSIVLVVTHGLSGDNTGTEIEGNSVYLEISKAGQAVFLFFSTDGKKWNVTRAFSLGPEQPLFFGFSAQSPKGTGTTATFSEIKFEPVALKPWSAN